MSFQDSLNQTLKFEGGYTVDDGGPTNYGITQSTYNDYRYKSVRDISPVEVADIYQKMYWVEANCDIIDAISGEMSMAHFDFSVNSGTGTAKRMLQRSLKVTEDGIIGADTLTALRQSLQVSKFSTIKNYLDTREAYDRSLANWPKYGDGEWLPRINKLRSLLLTPSN